MKEIKWVRVNMGTKKSPLYVYDSENVQVEMGISNLTVARFRIIKDSSSGKWEVRFYGSCKDYNNRFEGVWGCTTKKECIEWMETYNERLEFVNK